MTEEEEWVEGYVYYIVAEIKKNKKYKYICFGKGMKDITRIVNSENGDLVYKNKHLFFESEEEARKFLKKRFVLIGE